MDERTRVSSGSPFEAKYGFSRALGAGIVVEVAGTAPVWPDGHCDPSAYVQARRCLEIICDALDEAGATPDHVVRTRMYVTSVDVCDDVGRAHAEVFGAVRPASTMVVVQSLIDPRWHVEMEATALL